MAGAKVTLATAAASREDSTFCCVRFGEIVAILRQPARESKREKALLVTLAAHGRRGIWHNRAVNARQQNAKREQAAPAEWDPQQTKIAFFDIDGTLLNFHTPAPSAATVTALNKLHEQGVKLVIATGRAAVILPKFPDIPFDAFLTFNGSYCFDAAGHEIVSTPISTENVLQVIANAAAIGRPMSAATAKRVVANGVDKDMGEYFAIGANRVPVSSDFDQVVRTEPVFQLMCGAYEREHAALTRGVPGVKVVAWWERAVDIIPAQSGKNTGVKAILAAFGYTPSEALAFGDGHNDIGMLQAVGHGVAMGNARDEVKAVADAVAPSVMDDGIARYLEATGLI